MITKEIKINGTVVTVEVAKTEKEQAKGLAGRDELCQTCGMLFEYDNYQIRHFWMKDMKFSLDILWVVNSEIVGIEKDIQILEEVFELIKQSYNFNK